MGGAVPQIGELHAIVTDLSWSSESSAIVQQAHGHAATRSSAALNHGRAVLARQGGARSLPAGPTAAGRRPPGKTTLTRDRKSVLARFTAQMSPAGRRTAFRRPPVPRDGGPATALPRQ
jgi:hypothetical protein